MFDYENKYLNNGYKLIAGIDEAGRGPLAGPVCVAIVVMPLDEEDRVFLQDYVGKLEVDSYNNFFDWLEKSCGTRKIAELNKEQGKKVVGILKNRKR